MNTPGRLAKSVGAVRATWYLLSVFAALLLTVNGVSAQTNTVIMHHGYFGDASTWAGSMPYFQSTFNATFKLTETGWRNTFEVQADTLTARYYGGPGQNAAFVAHSLGGILGRYMIKAGHPWAGLITVGTPHQGAPIAANALNGTAGRVITRVFTNVSAPFEYFPRYVSTLEALILYDLEYEALAAILFT